MEAMVLAGEWDPWKLESVRASAVLFSMLYVVSARTSASEFH